MSEPNIESKKREPIGMNVVSETLPQENKANQTLAIHAISEDATSTKQEQDRQRVPNKFANDELTLRDLDEVLSTTVFEDKNVKIPLFLVSLLTFTEEEQRNVVLTGESSLGKTYNMKECLWYFRHENSSTIVEINDVTPRALIHSRNVVEVDKRTLRPIDMLKAPKKGDPKEVWEEWNDLKRNTAYFLDLSNRIVVFYDIPNFDLLKSLRSLLSHDNVISSHLITDKSSSGSHRTKEVLIKGYFTAIFGSAYGEMDEQEISRNYLLSPTDSLEKIKKALDLQARKMTDPDFSRWYENEPSRLGLKNRVQLIKKANIKKVHFKEKDMENLKDWFESNIDNLAPKAQRDFPRLYALAEAWALLNFRNREHTPDNTCIYANNTDVEVAKQIYEPILKCNGLGLTPEEFEVWKMIEDALKTDSVGIGLRISEAHNIYYYYKKRRCSDKRLRGMLKNFCSAGLLREDKQGVIIVYHLIMHKEPKQPEATTEDGVGQEIGLLTREVPANNQTD